METCEMSRGDSIMVDKGFNIKNELDELGLNINIPAFAFQPQFSEEEVLETRKIASKRVVVEMAIRKIKSYKILSTISPIMSMAHINQIFTVCTLLSNFRVTLKSKQLPLVS